MTNRERCTARYPQGNMSGEGYRCTRKRGHKSKHLAYVPISDTASEPHTWTARCPCCERFAASLDNLSKLMGY